MPELGHPESSDFSGLGIDIEEIERFRTQIESYTSGKMARYFTPDEHAYCATFSDPAPHYAARWCAREAAVKAFAALGEFYITDFSVIRDGKRPLLALAPSVRAALAGNTPRIHLSLSHTPQIACAVVQVG